MVLKLVLSMLLRIQASYSVLEPLAELVQVAPLVDPCFMSTHSVLELMQSDIASGG